MLHQGPVWNNHKYFTQRINNKNHWDLEFSLY